MAGFRTFPVFDDVFYFPGQSKAKGRNRYRLQPGGPVPPFPQKRHQRRRKPGTSQGGWKAPACGNANHAPAFAPGGEWTRGRQRQRERRRQRASAEQASARQNTPWEMYERAIGWCPDDHAFDLTLHGLRPGEAEHSECGAALSSPSCPPTVPANHPMPWHRTPPLADPACL